MSAPTDTPRLYDLVVIGASAGGIEALSLLVATLPPDLPVPLVIAQHLDPHVPSHLGQILARRSTLPVRTVGEATTSEPLKPGTIYLVPADRDAEISDSTVQLRPNVGQHPAPSIDRLFTSAAMAYGERVIAVVLTGSGSDGTAGARAVKATGGTVLIENPQTASYPTMPASLPPTSVDLVVDLQRMGAVLADLISGAQTLTAPMEAEDTLAALLEQVRQQTGIDFVQYRTPTILRRLHRRIAATNAGTLHDYLQVLDTHPEEYQHLVASFLINVTEFFRDPLVYAYLRERILPDVLAQARTRGKPNELRIWSAGCSTGEEPYSVAMLLAELLGPEALQYTIRLFATDVDADAVAFARRGRYPAAALASVPDELRTRYFTPVEGGYEIARAIRGMVIFGEHDLGQRAPFPHMDLVMCRNVLIYFASELQLRALQLFAFSLRDGGYLVLGNAESAGALGAHFSQVDPHFKIYRRYGERVLVPPAPLGGHRPLEAPVAGPEGEQAPAQERLRLLPNGVLTAGPHMEHEPALPSEYGQRVHTARERFAEQILSLPIGVVVVDREYHVVTINNAAYTLLDIYRPAIGKDLLHLAERVPTKPLRAAIDRTFEITTERPAQSEQTIRMEMEPREGESREPAERRQLQITCSPHLRPEESTPEGTILPARVDAVVLFISELAAAARPETEGATAEVKATDISPPSTPREAEQAETIRRLTAQLEVEHVHSRDLRRANQELREDNDRFRRTNEELLVGQEDVQASSEEVKTINEEMQATNEELETLNEELEATVEELHTTNDDLMARSQELQALAEEREKQRQTSERERAQLAAVLAALHEAVLAVDATGAVVLTNAMYEQFLRQVDTTQLEDQDGQSLPLAAAPWRRTGEEQPFRMAFTLRAPDGTRQWFEASGQPITRDEFQLGGVVTIHDFSDRTLRGLYELLLAQVGHELAQPLTVLAVTLRRLEQRLATPPETPAPLPAATAEGQAMLTTALRQVRQLILLVRDLADLGRVQQDKLQLTRESVDLVGLAQRVVEDLALTQLPESPHPPIVVRAEPETGEPVRVFGDPLRLEQVLRNLLQNARKYAPESERIDVRVRRVHERGVPEMAELEVQDYGPGISAAEQLLIFTPFHQVARGGAAPQTGLGLGLYIVQHLVRAHGGQIEVRSPAGRGTVFTIRLPLAKDDAEAEPAPTHRPARTADTHPEDGHLAEGLGNDD